jgi:hypothetical protein
MHQDDVFGMAEMAHQLETLYELYYASVPEARAEDAGEHAAPTRPPELEKWLAEANSRPSAPPSELAMRILSADIVFRRVCDYASPWPLALVRLARTCRSLMITIRQEAKHAYAAFPARLLAKQGLRTILVARWQHFGYQKGEVDDALVGAAQGRRVEMARWLLTEAPLVAESLPAVIARPRPSIFEIEPAEKKNSPDAMCYAPGEAAIDSAIILFAEDCQTAFFGWLLGECRFRPSQAAVASAFVRACGCGKLGLAELAFETLLRAPVSPTPAEQQGLLVRAIEAARRMTCHHHVVRWGAARLQYLADTHTF